MWLLAAGLPAQELERNPPSDPAVVPSRGEEAPLTLQDTLGRDLASASYYQLLSRARELGLPETGNRDQLEQRLRNELGLPAEPVPRPPDRVIEIVSADRTEFERADAGDLVRLFGSVELRLGDRRDGSEHIVRANRVFLDSGRDLLTASGAVVYRFRQGERNERFVGETLSFDISDWSGWFLDGESVRSQSIDGTSIEFRFAGERISRSGENTIVLDNAVITSSRLEPPAYSIDADRIWVTGRGEWGLRSAVLRVGRVPVARVPFFFRPGDRLFVNPSLGIREVEGSYLQTTTYLRGQPERAESPFAILQVAEAEGDTRLERDGLFLVPAPEPPPRAQRNGATGTIRLIADVYARGGAAIGMIAEGLRREWIRDLDAELLIAVSPVVWSLAGLPSTATVDTSGTVIRRLDQGQVLGIRVPFRYSAGIETTLRLGDVNLGLELPLLSDPEFPVDFLSRSEQTNWLELLGVPSAAGTAIASSRNSLVWEVELAPLTLLNDVPVLGGRLRLERTRSSLEWRAENAESAIAVPPGTGPTSILRSSSDRYFRPDRYVVADTGLNWSTRYTLFRSRGTVAARTGESDLRPPWADAAQSEALPDPPLVGFAAPPLLGPPAEDRDSESGWTGSLQANLNLSLDTGGPFATDDWTDIADITWDRAYQSIDAVLRPRLSVDLGFPREWLSIGLQTAYTDRRILVDTFGNPVEPGSAVQRELEQAVQLNRGNLNQDVSLQLRPAPGFSGLQTLRLDYSAGGDLLRRSVVEADPEDPVQVLPSVSTWEITTLEPDWISRHRLSASLGEAGALIRSLSASMELPPRTARVSTSLSLALGELGQAQLGWSASRSVALGAADEPGTDDDWEQQPLSVGLGLSPAEWLDAGASVQVQLDEAIVAGFTLNLELGHLESQLIATRAPGFSFAGPGIGWQQETEEALELRRFGFSWSDAWEPAPLWKNRILLTSDARVSVRQNLDQVTDSLLSVNAGLRISVHEALSFRLGTTSVNRFLYRYLDAFSSQLGLQRRPLIPDLVDSFAIWSRPRRVSSFFNLQTLQASAELRLDSWVLDVDYRGGPELQSLDGGQQAYRWSGALSLTIQWDPIPELREELDIVPSDDGILLDLGSGTP